LSDNVNQRMDQYFRTKMAWFWSSLFYFFSKFQ